VRRGHTDSNPCGVSERTSKRADFHLYSKALAACALLAVAIIGFPRQAAAQQTSNSFQFIPVTPCRVADTRNPDGPFGGPEMTAGSTRTFDIPQSACGIPSTAAAYSLNVTVVPNTGLGYLSIWPSGEAQPLVSTLNSDGRVKANAAIVPAGTGDGVNVYVSDPTQVILDIDGYFVPAGNSSVGLDFYPLTPCRIADTRNPNGPLGGPFMSGGSSRAFPILSSNCNIPSTAQAYSLNVTAVPHTPLGYLTIWPTGQPQPPVSTLNSLTGVVTANAAVVEAGTGGEVSVFVQDDADVILDVNGYFAPPGVGGLLLYPVTPCRVIDTRNGIGPVNGVLSVNVTGSPCGTPSTAQAYVLNATVVPSGSLGYLTLWPTGETQPVVSTLNAVDGAITSNMAIVPTTNGSIDAFPENPTNLILDISSYFAPVSTSPIVNPGGPYIGTVGLPITFDGSKSAAPTGQTLTYSWNFGDGTANGTGVSPTHTYTATGTYTVCLTVTDTAGGSNTACTTVTISPPPVANAGGPYNGTPGQAITFDGSKSTGPSGETLAYSWNFGDKTSSTGVNPTHSYSSAGNYTVSLTVTDTAGGTNTATTEAIISVAVTGWKSLYPMTGGLIPTLIVDGGHTAYAVIQAASARVGKPGGTPGDPGGILKTVDQGLIWSGATGDLPAPVSGPVVADPNAPGVLYAWTTLGLYKTTNGGAHWNKLGLNLPTGDAIEQIAIAPTNSNRIYVSTMGASVQCSTDGGNTWTQCSNGLYAGPDNVTAMAVSPTNELVAYTATWRGLLFKTIDGGNQWVAISDTSNIWAVSQIYIAPSNPNVLYLTNDEYNFLRGTVLKSTDGGNTWTNAGRPDGTASDVGQLQILPADPNTVYATTSEGLYETTTGGGVWKQVFAPNSGGSYLLSVALDGKSTLYVGSQYSGVYGSTDGGTTWKQENNGVFNVQFAGLDVCSSAPNTIYAAAEGGVPIATADSGATWSQIGAAETTNGQVVIALACSPANPSRLLVGTEDYAGALHTQGVGNLLVTDNGGSTFYEASVNVQIPGYSFFPGSFGFNPIDPSLVNSSLQDYQGGFLYSVDGGSSWTQPDLIYIYPGEYAYHPNLANIVFTNANQYVGTPLADLDIAYSVNSGATWQISPVVGQGSVVAQGRLYTVALDQADPTVLYTAGYIQTEGTRGVYKFKVVYIGDQVSSVTRIPGTFLTNADVRQLLYNAATGYLYAATGSGVFRSKDGAASWTSLNGDLPYTDVNRISISPDGLHLYAGTNAGIYELDVP
jgi:PKD repeat protein